MHNGCHIGPVEAFTHAQGGHHQGQIAPILHLRQPGHFYVDHGRNDHEILIAQPRPRHYQFAVGGYHRVAVEDDPARFVAEQVGIDVADPKRATGVDYEPFARLRLEKREVTGRRIQDNIDAPFVEGTAGAIGNPGVFANLEPNANRTGAPPRQIEHYVAERVRKLPYFNLIAQTRLPRLEPARFVMQAVVG